MATNIFRSLKGYNYRLWTVGTIVSNMGSWMQSIAQDWLVLTHLTHHDASAMGLVVALQYGPQLLFMPFTGSLADRVDHRKLLLVTQALFGVLAFGLGILTLTGVVQLWHVFVFAFLFGCLVAFDAPVRQVFATRLVSEDNLMNAVALTSASYNAARLIGPVIGGVVIASIGTGWAFIANGVSFAAILVSLCFLRTNEINKAARAARGESGFLDGLRYVWSRPDLKAILLMLFILGSLGFNYPIFIAAMAVKVFHADAGHYGLLSSMMAIGTVTGALISASRSKPGFPALAISATMFTIACTAAAFAPNYWTFAAMLIVLGISTMTITTESNSVAQLSTAPHMRGRIMSLRLGVTLGGMPLGAPLMGWIANTYGPRWSLGLGALSGFAAACVALYAIAKKFESPAQTRSVSGASEPSA